MEAGSNFDNNNITAVGEVGGWGGDARIPTRSFSFLILTISSV